MAVEGKKYCLDTSGFSNPLEFMPEDIHPLLWERIAQIVSAGIFAATTEIYLELERLPGTIGECLKASSDAIRLEIGDDWDWTTYLGHIERMRNAYRHVISEYNGDRKGTAGLNDISIIALAKTLGLPVISMEADGFQPSEKRMRIPQVCRSEAVRHYTFNEFLRIEGIKI